MNMIKKHILLFILFILSKGIIGQQEFSLFQFSGIPQQNLVNPALMPDDKLVIGLPFLSSIKTSYNNKAYSPNEGLYLEDGVLNIDLEILVNNLNKKNYLNSQFQDQWLLVGYRLSNHYFKIGISEKIAFDFSFPNTLFDFLLKGNAHYLGERVSISNLKLSITNYREVSLGYTNKLNDKWQIGGHLNLLFGLANISNYNSSLGIYTNPENYEITIDGDVEINSSGLNSLEGSTVDYLKTATNFGLGIDIGAQYKLNEKWEFSTSLIDIGYINWKNDLKTLTNNSEPFTIKGLDIKEFIDGSIFNGDSIFTEIVDSLENEFALEEIEKKYTTFLPPKWYAGAKFYINMKNRVYTSTSMQFFPTGIRFGLSLGYELDINKHFGLTANYSLYTNSFSNLGLGFRFRGGPIQLYVISDSMLASFNLLNFKSVYFRFGINLLFGEAEEKKTVKNNLL